MYKKTSQKDIAQKVGVSTALVSYVLNNQKEGRINKAVAQKIREAAEMLNYRPNQIARSLRTNKTNTIGLILADISNPFYSSLARIIEDEAYKQGYTVIFGSSDENGHKWANLVEGLLNRQTDGLIISPPADSEAQIAQLQKQDIPFVLIDRHFPGVNTSSVNINNYSAAYRALEHLTENGCRRTGMIAYRSTLFHLNERKKGYLDALKNAGIACKKDWLQEVNISNNQAEIEGAMKLLLSLNKPVDSVLFGSNRIAFYALRYINSLSIKVPQDLAIVSFDESEIFDFFHSPVTYIKQPLKDIGRCATKILLENIRQKKETEQVVLAPDLIIRNSSIKGTDKKTSSPQAPQN